jgi:muramoyltetrapeptide carboxypeptidase
MTESAVPAVPAFPPGTLFGVIAPAGPVEPDRLAQVPALYEHFGYRCRVFPGCALRTGHLAGPDDARLADLHAALADDEVAAIHAIRGGYGCMRLLDGIDLALLRAKGKPLIGYSDLTALHALWVREGLPALHAPMAASDILKPGREADRDALFALLRDGVPAGAVLEPAPDLVAQVGTAPLRVPGVAEGPLVGGNLSLIASLLGTRWSWRFDGAILFVEDVSEQTYRVDRYLTQLRLAGVFDAVAGLVVGSFTEQDDPLPLLRAEFGALGKPVLGGWPAGHGTPNRPLPLGVRARLEVPADAQRTGRLTLGV